MVIPVSNTADQTSHSTDRNVLLPYNDGFLVSTVCGNLLSQGNSQDSAWSRDCVCSYILARCLVCFSSVRMSDDEAPGKSYKDRKKHVAKIAQPLASKKLTKKCLKVVSKRIIAVIDLCINAT